MFLEILSMILFYVFFIMLIASIICFFIIIFKKNFRFNKKQIISVFFICFSGVIISSYLFDRFQTPETRVMLEERRIEQEKVKLEKQKAKEQKKKDKQEEQNEENIEEINEDTITFNTSIKGRGNSDSGRNEPNYVGLYGYVVHWYGDLDFYPLLNNTPWYVPTYKRIDYDHYEENGKLEHKTTVKVISQNLTHEGYGRYSGYLNVVIPNDEQIQYIVNVRDFITNSYWQFDDIYESVYYGYCIAEYSQVSDKLPVDVNNKIYNINQGAKVLAIDRTGSYPGSDKVKNYLREIEAIYYIDNYPQRVFFNKEDLKILY